MNKFVKKFGIILLLIGGVFLLTACDKKVEKEKKTNKKKSEYDYLVLVNKYTKLPDDWEQNVELVDAKNAWDENIKIEKKAYDNYKKLADDLKEDGVIIKLDSVYRSVKEQQELWDEWSKDPEKGIEYVKKYVAVPGYSEHHTGLAVDICLEKDGELVYENDDMIADKETFSKIHEKIADYGFILRYLDGRDEITGYAYEPWHLRYVGSSEIAKDIMDKDITFEEYLDSITDLKENTSAAKYKIEKTLQEYFKEAYDGKVANSRFNITKIYSTSEEEKDPAIKSLKLGKQDVAFEVEYELMPKDGVDPNELTIPDGTYDKDTGWVKDIGRVGVLKYNKDGDTYSIENFGTGW